MTSILRLLYEREIIPPEAEVPHTEKYRSLMREAGERHTALIERMRGGIPGWRSSLSLISMCAAKRRGRSGRSCLSVLFSWARSSCWKYLIRTRRNRLLPKHTGPDAQLHPGPCKNKEGFSCGSCGL